MELPDKVRKSINTWLRDLDNIMVDLDTAKKAGVDGIDSLIEIAQNCKKKCHGLKQAFFPNKP